MHRMFSLRSTKTGSFERSVRSTVLHCQMKNAANAIFAALAIAALAIAAVAQVRFVRVSVSSYKTQRRGGQESTDVGIIECRLRPAVSKGRRNTLIWSVYNEVSHTDVLYGQAEVRDVGSVATRRFNGLDWPSLQSCIGFDIPSLGANRWDSSR
jgi:hypothetical protein